MANHGKNPPLAIIGGGNMGLAIVSGGLAGTGPLMRGFVAVAEPDEDKRATFKAMGVATFTSASAAIAEAIGKEEKPGEAQVLLAVKPQMLSGLADEVRELLATESRVVISILAGTPTTKVRAVLSAAAGAEIRVVRAMPNLPAKIRQGITALCAGAGTRPGDDSYAREIFGGIGPMVVTIEESLMDAFTAVAGSGPAYVFYMAEAMIQASVRLGFDESTARDIVRETIAGSGNLLADSAEAPEKLRAAVTSKGGTTEAACKKLDEAGVMPAIVEAIRAARDRGREIGK